MTSDSELFQKIVALLDEHGISYQLIEHEPVFTSEQAAKIRGTTLSQGAKALVLIGDKKPLMVVIPANLKADFSKIKKNLGIKDLRMATADEVLSLLGVEIGAVPPFANLLDIPLYVDLKLSQNVKIAFNPGVHIKSIIVSYNDYAKLTKPQSGDFTETQ